MVEKLKAAGPHPYPHKFPAPGNEIIQLPAFREKYAAEGVIENGAMLDESMSLWVVLCVCVYVCV